MHKRSQSEESFDEADLEQHGHQQQGHHQRSHSNQQQQLPTVVVGRPILNSGGGETGHQSGGNSNTQQPGGGGILGSSRPSSLAAAFLGLPEGSERKSPSNDGGAVVRRSVSDEFVNKVGGSGGRTPSEQFAAVGNSGATLGPPSPNNAAYDAYQQQQQQYGYGDAGAAHLGPPAGPYGSSVAGGGVPRGGVPMPPPSYHSVLPPQSSSFGAAGPHTPGRARGFSGSSINSNNGALGSVPFVGGSSGPTCDDGGRMGSAFAAPAPLPSFLRKQGSSNSIGGGGSGNTTPSPQQTFQQQGFVPGVDMQQQLMPPPAPPALSAGGSSSGSNNASPVGGVPIPRSASGGAVTSSGGNSLGSAPLAGSAGKRFAHNPYGRSPNRSPKN